LRDAETALQKLDFNKAMACYRDVIRLDSRNPLHRMKLGLLLKQEGLWNEAIAQFNSAVALSPNYAEAWREKGVAENKLACALSQKTKIDPQASPAPGEADLRRAIELNDKDVLSREVSHDHPYPLLNEIKLRVFLTKNLELTGDDRRALQRAASIRQLQVKQDPPYDSPWCFFDLAEIKLYEGDAGSFETLIKQGIAAVSENWQARSVRSSLSLLEPAASNLLGLERGLKDLDCYLAP
jgi:tetratricopeptide (TPR) repeat protein